MAEMPGTRADLMQARLRATEARVRLIGTMGAIQKRFTPRALLEEAVDEMRERGEQIADQALAKVRAHPVAAAGVVAFIVALFFRGTLLGAFKRLLDSPIFSLARETNGGDDGSDGEETLYEAHPLWAAAPADEKEVIP